MENKETQLQQLGQRMIGSWTTEGTHPMRPGVTVNGWADIDWLSGEKFLILRSGNDNPEFPDAVSIVGDTDGMKMHYFDSRGVHRVYDVAIADDGWTTSMKKSSDTKSYAAESQPFSQRTTFTFKDADQTMFGDGQMSHDDKNWEGDLQITYRKV